MRIRTEAGGKSCHLILLRFGDLVSVPGREAGNVPFKSALALASFQQAHMSQVNVSKVVHKLLENLKK